MSKIVNEYRIVSSTIAAIYNKPTFDSELTTQALIWEKLIIYDKKDNWYQVQQRDGYIGWIHSFYTSDSSVYDSNQLFQDLENWYWVKNKFLSLSLNDNSNYLLSFGSLVPCFEKKGSFFIILPNNEKVSVDKSLLTKFTDEISYEKGVLHSASELVGTPYLWGGKSSFGFDCSGLIQSIINVCNVNITNSKRSFLPRDASKQILSDILMHKKGNPTIGDIIFFRSNKKINHVGIYINKRDFIHSSGFVKVNSLDKESKNYSNKLEEKVYGIYTIK